MGDNISRYEQWAAAQASAFAAEHRVAQAALRHAAGAGAPPTVTDLQGALILRSKASALLRDIVLSGTGPQEAARDGVAQAQVQQQSHAGG
jgi:hypothetical protein